MVLVWRKQNGGKDSSWEGEGKERGKRKGERGREGGKDDRTSWFPEPCLYMGLSVVNPGKPQANQDELVTLKEGLKE